jgi:hypothetical protein
MLASVGSYFSKNYPNWFNQQTLSFIDNNQEIINYGKVLAKDMGNDDYHCFRIVDEDKIIKNLYYEIEDEISTLDGVDGQWIIFETKDTRDYDEKDCYCYTKPICYEYGGKLLIIVYHYYYTTSERRVELHWRAVIYGADDIVNEFIVSLMPKEVIKVYKFSERPNGEGQWSRDMCEINFDVSLAGADVNNVYVQMRQDLKDYKTYEDQFKFFGKTQGLNYLLIGPPGNGKTSIIKKIVKENSGVLYRVNLSNIKKNENLNNVLTIKKDYEHVGKKNFIIMEDFDRYITTIKNNNGSDGVNYTNFLNNLDGLESNENTVRIFTANESKNIVDEALVSRFKRIFYLDNPTEQIVIEHLTTFFTKYHDMYDVDKKMIEKFAEIVVRKYGLNMRLVNNFLARFIGQRDMISLAINSIPNYINELKMCAKEGNILCY